MNFLKIAEEILKLTQSSGFKINVEVIPHNKQRYNTTGDYWTDEKGVIQFRISKMSKEVYEWLVLLHEMKEFFLVKMTGISEEKIYKFDIKFEEDKKKGLHSEEDEPGDEKDAPYYKQHNIATADERELCGLLNIAWKDYEDECNRLTKSWKHNRKRELRSN